MRQGQVYTWQDDAILHRFAGQDFDPAYWIGRGSAQPIDGGRGGSSRIHVDGRDYVLRRYLRGGMVQRVLEDQYLWTGLASTRPAIEQRAVRHALDHQLPVPAVAAWQVLRRGLLYRAVIISRFIPHRSTLAGWLARQDLSVDDWASLGRLLRRMHEAGIDHADLNADNILIDESGDFYLIDFDRARIRPAGGDWRRGNLARLQRSLLKISRRLAGAERKFHFSDKDWQRLLAAYR